MRNIYEKDETEVETNLIFTLQERLAKDFQNKIKKDERGKQKNTPLITVSKRKKERKKEGERRKKTQNESSKRGYGGRSFQGVLSLLP